VGLLQLTSDKWYKEGLRFACTACGNCCTGPPGYVWVTREEIRRIARYLERQDDWLSPETLRRVGFKYSLTERNNGDCVFLEPACNGRRGCRIYPVRPLQCRTWPFWTINLKSPACWAQTSETCLGMNSGREYRFDEVEGLRLKKDWE
jgi:hypothetical protein